MGRAHGLFIDENLIVLEDAEMGDLGALEATRDTFCLQYRGLHPEETRSGSAGVAGKFFRYAVEMVKGDLVVYPALPDKQVYVGEITGDYHFVEGSDYPHQRRVKWKFIIPKSELSMQAQYELGAARTLFEFKRNRDELLKRISGEGVTRFTPKSKSKA
jgi:predicted Mrr-cat superfamily restriction endonuclease